MVELALIAFLGYFFIAFLLTFGQYFYSGQIVQQAADLAARELSRTPLPANATFNDLISDPMSPFSQEIYSEDFLVIDVSAWVGSGMTILEYLDTLSPPMPIVNKALVPLMYVERIGGTTYLRYPGALIDRGGGNFTVAVPIITNLPLTGGETIVWSRVLEEIPSANDPVNGSFPLSSSLGGVAAIRVNYPYQSGTMSQHGENPMGPFTPTIGLPVEADDSSVTVTGTLPTGGTAVDSTGGAPGGVYAGEFGLGKQQARGKVLRPYRRVITAQAIFRREVFE